MLRPSVSTTRALTTAGLLTLFATAAFGEGTPRSIGDCERLKNDLAYNQCLAMFGPAAKNVSGGDGGGGGGGPTITVPPPEPSVIAGMPALEEPMVEESGRRGRRGRRSRGGRQSASFDVGGSSESGSSHRRHRRRR